MNIVTAMILGRSNIRLQRPPEYGRTCKAQEFFRQPRFKRFAAGLHHGGHCGLWPVFRRDIVCQCCNRKDVDGQLIGFIARCGGFKAALQYPHPHTVVQSIKPGVFNVDQLRQL